jgi:lysophospholipase L1-like esterase
MKVEVLHTLGGRGTTITIGALGDSYTDEYRNYPPDRNHARNWVEILAATRRINFGSVVQAGANPASRGFSNNFAVSGATTTDMVETELPRLLPEVASGKLGYVTIFIGGNDFINVLDDVVTGTLPAASAPDQLAQVETRAQSNVQQTVSRLLAANPNVRIAVATVADVTELPIVQFFTGGSSFATVRSAASQAVAQYDAAIRDLTSESGRIAIVDLAALTTPLAQGPSSFSFGGATIAIHASGDDYHDLFLADGLHMGTVGQGMIANAFISTLDTSFGAQIQPLTPAQIVRFSWTVQIAARTGGGPI